MADALVWLGRYQQRLETLGKETLVQFDAIIDRDSQAGKMLFAKLGSQIEYACATQFLHEACYGQHGASLLTLSAQARENAIIIRDLLSDSLFGSVNSVYHALKAQENNASLDAYQLTQLLTEIEYFWGRLDLKMRLYGEVDALLEDAHQLNLYGSQLSENWLTFDPINHNQNQNMNSLQACTSNIIHYDI
jgi:uncharacterized alpha-E superfamily protein